MPLTNQATDWIADLQANLDAVQPEVTIVPARSAGDGTETIVFRVPTGVQSATVTAVSFISATAITGAATNYQTLSVRHVSSGTAAAITGATTFATTASLTAFTTKYLFQSSGTVAALTLKPGDAVTLRDVATGTGATLPEMSVVVEYDLTYADQ